MADKPRFSRLWQEIALTLLVKAVLLAVIWAAWFSAPEQRTLDDRKVASQIFSRQSPSPQFQKERDHAVDY